MRSVPRIRKKSIVRCELGSWKPVQLGSSSEIGDSQRKHEAVNMEVEGSTALEAVTGQRLVKTQQTGVLVRIVVSCTMCELAIAL
jgi:hypothetical protein